MKQQEWFPGQDPLGGEKEKTGDVVGQESWGSSFLGDADATF